MPSGLLLQRTLGKDALPALLRGRPGQFVLLRLIRDGSTPKVASAFSAETRNPCGIPAVGTQPPTNTEFISQTPPENDRGNENEPGDQCEKKRIGDDTRPMKGEPRIDECGGSARGHAPGPPGPAGPAGATTIGAPGSAGRTCATRGLRRTPRWRVVLTRPESGVPESRKRPAVELDVHLMGGHTCLVLAPCESTPIEIRALLRPLGYGRPGSRWCNRPPLRGSLTSKDVDHSRKPRRVRWLHCKHRHDEVGRSRDKHKYCEDQNQAASHVGILRSHQTRCRPHSDLQRHGRMPFN